MENSLDTPLAQYPALDAPDGGHNGNEEMVGMNGTSDQQLVPIVKQEEERHSRSTADGVEPMSEVDTAPLNPSTPYRGTWMRFPFLMAQAFMMFGSYYFFDQMSSIGAKGLSDYGIKITDAEFGVLQSVYSFPNIVLPLIGGMFLDRIGFRIAIMALCGLVLSGQIIFSIGILSKQFWLMIIGQLVFGIGGESLNVASSSLVAVWFKNREMAFAMGTTITVSRIGSAFAMFTQPYFETHYSIAAGTLFAFCVVGCSFMCATLCGWLDKKADDHDKKNGLPPAVPDAEEVSLALVKKFDSYFWLLSISCVAVYVSVFPFLKITATPFLVTHLPQSIPLTERRQQGPAIAALITIVSAVASPIAGLFIDRVGMRPFWVCSSAFVLACIFITFAAYPVCVHASCEVFLSVLVAFIGFPLALYGAALWTVVPLVVEANCVGTAYGLITAVQNLGLTLAPITLSLLQGPEGDSNFTAPFLFIVACDIIGFTSAVILWAKDIRAGGKLSLPSIQ